MDTKTPTPVPPFQEPKKNRDPLYITIIILLLGTGIFLFVSMNQYKGQLDECSANNDMMQKDIEAMNQMLKNNGMVDLMGADLKDNLKQLLEEYETLETDNSGLKDSITNQIHKIDSLQKLAEKHKGDAYMIYKLKKETETLRRIMQGYVHTIDSLNTLNEELRTTIKTKDRELTDVKQERDDVKDKNKELETKVAKGSVLQTTNLSSGAIHLRSSGKQVETTRAGRADMVKACCSIMENPISKAGTKQLYMVVIKPDGTIMTKDPNATFTWEGGDSQYSLLREIDYQNQTMDLCLYAEVDTEDLPKGVYIVEIYCEKAKIGKSSFTLK